MGEVFVARTQWQEHPIAAVKRLRPDVARVPTFAERFQHEAALSVRLSHPNLVGTYGVGAVEGQLYVASELVLGKDTGVIADRLRARGQGGPAAVAIRLLIDTLAGLAYVHEVRESDGQHLHLVHRDVTPGNVLVGYDGLARVADFGLAKSALTKASNLTNHGEILGTPHYLAPELIRSQEATPASDLYGLGAVIYRFLTGIPPHQGATTEVLLKVLSNEPKPLSGLRPDLPGWLVELVHALLAKSVGVRPSSATEVLKALTAEARDAGLLVPRTSVGRWLAALFEVERAEEVAERDRVRALEPEKFADSPKGTVVLARSEVDSRLEAPPSGISGEEMGLEAVDASPKVTPGPVMVQEPPPESQLTKRRSGVTRSVLFASSPELAEESGAFEGIPTQAFGAPRGISRLNSTDSDGGFDSKTMLDTDTPESDAEATLLGKTLSPVDGEQDSMPLIRTKPDGQVLEEEPEAKSEAPLVRPVAQEFDDEPSNGVPQFLDPSEQRTGTPPPKGSGLDGSLSGLRTIVPRSQSPESQPTNRHSTLSALSAPVAPSRGRVFARMMLFLGLSLALLAVGGGVGYVAAGRDPAELWSSTGFETESRFRGRYNMLRLKIESREKSGTVVSGVVWRLMVEAHAAAGKANFVQANARLDELEEALKAPALPVVEPVESDKEPPKKKAAKKTGAKSSVRKKKRFGRKGAKNAPSRVRSSGKGSPKKAPAEPAEGSSGPSHLKTARGRLDFIKDAFRVTAEGLNDKKPASKNRPSKSESSAPHSRQKSETNREQKTAQTETTRDPG